MKSTSSICAHTTIVAARVLGGTSLLALVVFLLWGPVQVVDLNLTTAGALGFDGLLCLAFFLQHSGMVRKSFQDRLATFVPSHFNGAIYATASGVVLLALLVFWQPTELTLARVDGSGRWILRVACVAAGLGFVWGIRALGTFDPFGVRPIKASLSGKTLREQALTIRGPYKWVRHPLYSCVLVLLWCYPDFTADRLLFNTAWTSWIFIGTILEERDLVSAFGAQYREYQRNVPMLLPLRIPRSA